MPRKSKKKPANKATNLQMIERVDQVKKWLLLEYSHEKIFHYGVKKWRLCERTLRTYIQRATKEIEETVLESHDEFRQKMKLHYHELIEIATKDKDFGEVRRIIADMNRVLGYDKVTVVTEGDPVIKIVLPDIIKKSEGDNEQEST